MIENLSFFFHRTFLGILSLSLNIALESTIAQNLEVKQMSSYIVGCFLQKKLMKATESYNYQNPFDCFFSEIKTKFPKTGFSRKSKKP